MRMRAGKGTDSQLEVRERLAELLRPALEDARLALHAPDRDLVQGREVLQPRPDAVREAVERPDDELAERERLQDVEVLHEVAFVADVGAFVGPGEAYEVHAESERFSADLS